MRKKNKPFVFEPLKSEVVCYCGMTEPILTVTSTDLEETGGREKFKLYKCPLLRVQHCIFFFSFKTHRLLITEVRHSIVSYIVIIIYFTNNL